jgi:uncharacterized membrane protein
VVGVMFNFYLVKRGRKVWEGTRGSGTLIAWLGKADFWATAVIVGGLGFLNIWDFPIYVVIFAMVYTLLRFQQQGWHFKRLLFDFLSFVILLGLAGLLLYLPFYLGFTSQAGGLLLFLPSLAFFTPGVNFWIMFATLLIPIFAWLTWLVTRKDRPANGSRQILLKQGLFFSLAVVFGLWLLSYLVGLVFVLVLNSAPDLAFSGRSLSSMFYGWQGSTEGSAILGQTLLERITHPGTWLTLFGLLTLCWGLIGALRGRHSQAKALDGEAKAVEEEHEESDMRRGDAIPFVLVLILAGAGLALFPEFFYLRDDFGTRMNTVFKFYFQTWILWACAAAFGTVILWKNIRSVWGALYAVISLVVIGIGLIFPYYGFMDRMGLLDSVASNDFALIGLDGTAYVQNYNSDEWAAIQWLQNAPDGVIIEAVGGQYSQYARIATLTGLQNVLGWPGHEAQWRGTRVNFYPRSDDVKLLYETSDWEQAKIILEKYDIHYIYLGGLERASYAVYMEKFTGKVAPVFQNNSVIIYEYIP